MTSEHIKLSPHRFDVAPVAAELAEHPELWNEYTGRLTHPQSPHRFTDDIWLRFADVNLGNKVYCVKEEHRSIWYPASKVLEKARCLAIEMFLLTQSTKLGGVLIIRIPPGKSILPHQDLGWHALYYSKFAVQIVGNEQQDFAFKDGGVSPVSGESYFLDNRHTHWVDNPTDQDWINMTVCYRRDLCL